MIQTLGLIIVMSLILIPLGWFIGCELFGWGISVPRGGGIDD